MPQEITTKTLEGLLALETKIRAASIQAIKLSPLAEKEGYMFEESEEYAKRVEDALRDLQFTCAGALKRIREKPLQGNLFDVNRPKPRKTGS